MRLTADSDVLRSLLRAPAPKPKQPSARERAAANRVRVLQTVAANAHLRCADIASACWSNAKYGQQMAQRTVRALVQGGELLGRRNATGGMSYVLTRRGAAALEVRGIPAHHGLDLASVSGATFAHHALTSRWCIHKRSEGFEAYSEYAIVNGRAPVTREQLIERYGKLCDAALVKPQTNELWLCECEVAPKGADEVARVVSLAERVGRKVHPELPLVLAGVFIVFDAELNHGERIARVARERWSQRSAADRALLASHITLSRVHLAVPLVWRGCTQERLSLI